MHTDMRARSEFFLRAALLAGVLVLQGCLGPIDTLGSETVVIDHEHLTKDAQLEDDRIEDKHPVVDPQSVVTETFGHCTLKLNKSGSVTKLDIVPFSAADQALDGQLFASRGAAAAAARAAGQADLVPSMEVINGAMKPFNDGLYAAVEVAEETGPRGKRALLGALLQKLLDARASATTAQRAALFGAAVFLGAAIDLGGATPALPADLLGEAQKLAAAFRTNTLYARPIGFYGWTPELEHVFTQDRFLQSGDQAFELSFAAAAAIAAVLEPDVALTQDYEHQLALASRLTNPFTAYPLTALFPFVDGPSSLHDVGSLEARFRAANPSLRLCDGPLVTVLPASASKDSAYYSQLFCAVPPKPGVNFIDLLIAAIRDGKIDLAPGAGSGWYDYQLYALETLLVPERGPESDHLLLTAAYKKKLIETFKSLITQARETHVKQLAIPAATSAPMQTEVDVYPKLPVEPFPTFYLRSARAYRFLHTYLAALEPELLASGHRLVEDGTTSSPSLGDELRAMTARLYGLHALAAESVGVAPRSSLLADELADFPLEMCRAQAQEWLAGWGDDPDVARDPRVIVPVGGAGREIIYWATIGVKVLKASAAFVPGYEPTLAPDNNFCTVKGFVPRDYYWLSEEMVEVRLRAAAAPPTRAELHALCDEKKTREAIVAALEAL